MIPKIFINSISEGECTLFLGAGASIISNAPSAEKLSEIIADKVLGDKGWIMPLDRCISIANTSSTQMVLEILITKLKNLEPSPAHHLLPCYPWRAIATTNYDQLIEKTYEDVGVQKLVPIFESKDLTNLGLAKTGKLPYFKLHGCITRKDLIVASLESLYEQRNKHRPLYSYIESLHCIGPVIYIGYSLRDTHILDLLYDITNRLGKSRHPFLFVTYEPNQNRANVESAWFLKVLNGQYYSMGFEKFMEELSAELTSFSGPSHIVKALSPCQAEQFECEAKAEADISDKNGPWECWLKYRIFKQEGWAGVNFISFNNSVDLSHYKRLEFEINVPKTKRYNDKLEALNISSTGSKRQHQFQLLPIERIKGKGWRKIKWDLSVYDKVDFKSVVRLSLADNGYRTKLNQEYTIGLRNINFF